MVKIICDSIAEIAKEMGPVAVHKHMDQIMKLLFALMKQESFCQSLPCDEFEDEDDEQDHDQVLIDAVFETVDELAKVYGPGFAQLWQSLLTVVLTYLHPKKPYSDHVMALGTLAEVCPYLLLAPMATGGCKIVSLIISQAQAQPQAQPQPQPQSQPQPQPTRPLWESSKQAVHSLLFHVSNDGFGLMVGKICPTGLSAA